MRVVILLMNLYKSLIWCSLLFIIIEGWTLAGYELDPLPVKKEERVLGERTVSILDDASAKTYPASYYSDPVINDVVPEEGSASAPTRKQDEEKALEQAGASDVEEETAIITETKIADESSSISEGAVPQEFSPDRKTDQF